MVVLLATFRHSWSSEVLGENIVTRASVLPVRGLQVDGVARRAANVRRMGALVLVNSVLAAIFE